MEENNPKRDLEELFNKAKPFLEDIESLIRWGIKNNPEFLNNTSINPEGLSLDKYCEIIRIKFKRSLKYNYESRLLQKFTNLNFKKIGNKKIEVDFNNLRDFTLSEEEREDIIDNVIEPSYHIQEIFTTFLWLLFEKEGKLTFSQVAREELKGRLGKLKLSNPNEQKLFSFVYEINMNCNKRNYAFRPYKEFRELNDKHELISNELIQEEKFSKSDLYNRYKQYRTRRNKKEYSNTLE